MFSWYDYLILFVVLLISVLIGVYHGYLAKNPKTAKDYLTGGKQMKIIPVAISVTVGHFSAILLIAVPSDVYRYGAFNSLLTISVILVIIASIFIFYPKLFQAQVFNAFEYLEKVFDRKVRLLGCLLFVLCETVALSATIYTPALALSLEIDVNLLSTAICAICIFYTTIGGLRTVIWTDLLQFFIIITSLVIISSVGIKSSGGFTELWTTAARGGRLDIFDFDLDPTKKDTFWSFVLGATAYSLYYFSLSQSSVQKYLSLPTQRDCTKSLIVFGGCLIMVVLTVNFLGLILYATYANCDPFLNHQIANTDKIMPYFVGQIAKNIPGLSGLFITSLVSAGISTLSSSLSAVSGVIYDDFVAPYLKDTTTEKSRVRILKCIVILHGIVCNCLVLMVPLLGEVLHMLVGSVGILNGPALGLFILAVLFPRVSSNCTFLAGICSLLFGSSVYIQSKIYFYNHRFSYRTKPLSTAGCAAQNLTAPSAVTTLLNFTKIADNSTDINATEASQPFFLFRLTYHYYCFVGALLTVILALLFDYILKMCRDKKTHVITSDPDSKAVNEKEMQPFLS